MKLTLLLSAVTTASAWSVTFHDHDQCAGGTTFHYGGGSNTGTDHLAQCFTMSSINKSFANYDAKSVNIVFGGCTIDIFTDRLTRPGLEGCVASISDPTNWQRINQVQDGCIQLSSSKLGKWQAWSVSC
ncbi:hypothetical protein CSIM01_07121 [Colletotrichum simmondsii]|uniref:Ecp2 effector protein domain-containing protein n=1 Tax=Colletotrichum simmondsii TaxID=703756 RepID=A0A135SDY0_9PEZI|nr:hypothetical protein CSIM01_07121 [Colletotrichum simmondsii]